MPLTLIILHPNSSPIPPNHYPNPNQAEAGLPVAVWIAAAVEGDAQAVAAWLDKCGGVDAGCAEHHDTTLLMAAAAIQM